MLRRWRVADSERIEREFAEAYALAVSGRRERARDQYARLAKRLASAPDGTRHYRGLALLREAEIVLAMGNFSEAMACFREAVPLLADPARQLPKWLLRQFAEERMQAAAGDLAPLFTFLRATASGAEPGDETDAAIRTLTWLQRRCLVSPPEIQEDTARAAMAAMPGVDWPVLALTAVLRRAGRVAEAETTLASLAHQGSGDLWFRWGIQLSTLQRYTKAVSAFDEALRRAPGAPSPWSIGPSLHAESLLYRGLARQQLGKSRLAGNDLRAASGAAPRDPRIHYSLGRLAVELDADGEAGKHFTAALTARSTFAQARLGLALLHERAGRPAEAIAHYRAALRLDPNSRPARVRLGAVVLAAGRREEAEALLHPEVAESHWGTIATFHYGLARLRANDPDGALGTWERLSGGDLGEWTAAARDRAARHLLAADPAAARALWQRAVTDAPDADGYRIALREASLREAAQLVLTGRDNPEARDAAAAALAGAASLADPDPDPDPDPEHPATDIRSNRLRAALALAGGSTKDVNRLLDPSATLLDRCHLAAVALVTDRSEQAEALLQEVDPDPDCDPAEARLRALLAERAENWSEALHWHQRFLSNTVPADGLGANAAGAPDGAQASASVATAVAEDTDDAAVDRAVDTEAETVTVDILVLTQAPFPTANPSGDSGPAAVGGARRSHCTTAIGGPCAEISSAACGGCGREGCAVHLYRPAGATALRCARCAGPALRAVLDCARRAGTPDMAEPALTSWAEALRDSPLALSLRRSLALLQAETGDLDGALASLPAEAVRERVATLIRRAAAAIGSDEPFRAIDDLRQATRLQPGHPQALATLDALAEYEARRHAVEGRLQEAFDTYLALLRRDPMHPRLLHALGLTSYRLAAATGIPEYWDWTIGCLVSCLHIPELWAEVARSTGRPAGQPQITNARDGLTDRLREDLRKADASLNRTGDETGSWSVLLGMEISACEILVKAELVRVPTADGGERLLVVGPTLDRLLRQQPETPGLAVWREHADGLRDADLESHGDQSRIAGLFGRYGPHYFLCEEGRYSAAVAALVSVPDDQRDAGWKPLLRRTLVTQGKEHHQNQEWRAALEVMTRAAPLFADGKLPPALTEIAADSGLRAARAMLRAGENDERGAVDFLESAAAVAPDFVELRVDLASAYARLARKTSAETTDHAIALAQIRKALVLAHDAPLARQVLEAVAAKRADQLTRPGPDGDLLQAAELWRELIGVKPDPGYRLGLSRALLLLARSAAVADDRGLALERTVDALLADPEWSGDAAREAPRRVAVLLANHVTEDLSNLSFDERAELLRTARSYRDFPELRALMLTVWRSEAVIDFDSQHYTRCATLLEEALTISGDAQDTAHLHGELAVVYSADAVRAAKQHQHLQARALITLAVVHAPDDIETLALQARINATH